MLKMIRFTTKKEKRKNISRIYRVENKFSFTKLKGRRQYEKKERRETEKRKNYDEEQKEMGGRHDERHGR